MRTRTSQENNRLDTSSQGIHFGSALVDRLRHLAWRKRTTVSEPFPDVMSANEKSHECEHLPSGDSSSAAVDQFGTLVKDRMQATAIRVEGALPKPAAKPYSSFDIPRCTLRHTMNLHKNLTEADTERKASTRPTCSALLEDGSIVEMCHRRDLGTTCFFVFQDGRAREEVKLNVRGEALVPYSPKNNLLQHDVILLPSEPLEYDTTDELRQEIRQFIHRFVDVSEAFEELATHYILFSWIYDNFNELPYLRVRGDTGSGKTRCLLTIGSLCYKPIFASGASTVSPLFRILDAFQGTLIVDEGDFRFSDERADMIKILNQGNARGFPVLRTESTNGKELNPTAFAVFGPKFIATRKHFDDLALESRCLTEETGGRRMRSDIPLNLSEEWKQEALTLRNKLLMFRFRNYGKRTLDPGAVDRSIEPRLAQVFGPLLTVIDDPEARARFLELGRKYHEDLRSERTVETEAQVMEVVRDLLATNESRVSIRDVTKIFQERFGDDYERRITPKWIGNVVRRDLQLKTHKSHGVFVLAPIDADRLRVLLEKYGLTTAGGE